MTFDRELRGGGEDGGHGSTGSSPGKRTLSQRLPAYGDAPTPSVTSAASASPPDAGGDDPFGMHLLGASAQADLYDGGSEARAWFAPGREGRVAAEGAHPGIVKGGGKRKRRVGLIQGGSFTPAPEGGAAPADAAPGATPTAAPGAEGERAFTGSAWSHQADRTVTSGPTTIRMEDESAAHATMITAAVARARELVNNALSKLGSPTNPAVAAALNANFHTTDSGDVSNIRAKLTQIQSAFNGTIPIEVEDEGTARAYVYVIWSDIHLCPPWFADPDPDGRARTIIHECSHKYSGTDDKAYHWSGDYATLSKKDAMNNADSYAWFCIDVR